MKMNNWKKISAMTAATGLIVGTLAGCGSTTSTPAAPKDTNGTAATPAKTPVNVVLWSHWASPELDVLKTASEEWAKKTGNTVTVKEDKSQFADYVTAAKSGKGPDIEFGIAHDNLGNFAKAGLLEQVPDGLFNTSDYVPIAWQAVTVEGKKVAVPFSMETYGLFYNTDKIKSVPTTWDDFASSAKSNGFMYDINNAYFSYAFISGFGGYVFKNTNGVYDINDIGMGNEGATKGYQLLQDMTQKYKFMPADVNGDVAKAQFTQKKTSYYISGPWDTAGLQKAGVPFAIAPLPTLPNGQQPKTFVGVQTALVNSNSQHKQEAWDLLKYLSQNTGEKELAAGSRIPVLNSVLNSSAMTSNTVASAFAKIAQSGEPMPNVPAMSAFWTPVGNGLKLLTTGKTTPDKAASDIVSQIKEGIKALK